MNKSPAPTAKGSRMLHLDILRTVAAQLVLVGHASSLLVVHASGVFGSRDTSLSFIDRVIWRAIELFTGRGSDAVFIFFVLSGFLVGHSALKQHQERRFDLESYLLKRVSRMYSVLVPALLLSSLGIYLAFTTGRGPAFIDLNTPWYPADWPVQESMSLATATCNLLFLQTIFCPQFGHNSSLWSLSNEFLYYLLFAAILVFLASDTRRTAKQLIALICILSICTLWALPAFGGDMHRTMLFLAGWLVWLTGAFAPAFVTIFHRLLSTNLAAHLVFLGGLMILYLKSGYEVRVTVAVLIALYGISFGEKLNEWISEKSFLRSMFYRLSDSSFSLYVVHVPIIFVTVSLAEVLPMKLPNSLPLAFVAILVLINCAAWLFYLLFEQHHQRIFSVLKSYFISKTSATTR
jgi:peptidoglycan/LPS O-acetylase OafA/YrhL